MEFLLLAFVICTLLAGPVGIGVFVLQDYLRKEAPAKRSARRAWKEYEQYGRSV